MDVQNIIDCWKDGIDILMEDKKHSVIFVSFIRKCDDDMNPVETKSYQMIQDFEIDDLPWMGLQTQMVTEEFVNEVKKQLYAIKEKFKKLSETIKLVCVSNKSKEIFDFLEITDFLFVPFYTNWNDKMDLVKLCKYSNLPNLHPDNVRTKLKEFDL
tara:strand:- start:181 stop:648 length:468 start_codon:yes stop_codon:yes gene_type:complete